MFIPETGCGRTRLLAFGLLALFGALATATPAQSADKRGATWWLVQSHKALATIDNYTSLFHIQEKIGGKLTIPETMAIKFKKPYKVYMKWTEGPRQGTELIFIKGWNGNRMRVRPSGIIGLFSYNISPTSSLAMKNNRHPVTHTGLEFLMEMITDNVRRGVLNHECILKDHGEGTIYGRKYHRFEGIFPKDAKLAKERNYYCYRAVVDMDMEYRVPVQVQIFDWNDEVLEVYGYEKTRLDAKLTDKDFDPANPEYRLK